MGIMSSIQARSVGLKDGSVCTTALGGGGGGGRRQQAASGPAQEQGDYCVELSIGADSFWNKGMEAGRVLGRGTRPAVRAAYGWPLAPHLMIGRMQSLTRRAISADRPGVEEVAVHGEPATGGQPEAGRSGRSPGSAVTWRSFGTGDRVAGRAVAVDRVGHVALVVRRVEVAAVPALREVEVGLQHRAGRAVDEVVRRRRRHRRAGRTSGRWCCRSARSPSRCRPRSAARTAAAGSARSRRRGHPRPGSRRCPGRLDRLVVVVERRHPVRRLVLGRVALTSAS